MNPFEIGDRILSPLRPHGTSIRTRIARMCRRIGWEMIKAHPWLGVGPEQVGRQASELLPPGTRCPLPSEYYGHLDNDLYSIRGGARDSRDAGADVDDRVGAVRFRPRRWLRDCRRDRRSAMGAARGDRGDRSRCWSAGWFEWNLDDSTVLAMFLAVIGCGYVAVVS